MNRDSNMARDLRATQERLRRYAQEYDEAGKHAECEAFDEVANAVGALHSLPDPEEDE